MTIPVVEVTDAGEIEVVEVFSYFAALEPVVLAYLNGQLTRREFIARVNLLKRYS